MTPPTPLDATLADLSTDGQRVNIRLHTRGGTEVQVSTQVPPVAARAFPHIHALHGHSPGCAGQIDLHVDLLLRCCRVLGGSAGRVLIRTGPSPAFWLEVTTPVGDRALVDLSPLDALVLLASRRLQVAVDAPATAASEDRHTDWDAELRRLLDDA